MTRRTPLKRSPIRQYRANKPIPRKTPLGAYGDAEAIIASPAEYERRLAEMVVRQGHKCADCQRPFTAFLKPTFGHECSRRGGKRDDRIWKEDGSRRNAALYGFCNVAQGSRRFGWVDGRWQAIGVSA